MKTLSRFTFAAIAIDAILVAPAALSADSASDEAAILEIWSTYSASRVAGDAERWLGLWDKEGIRMQPGASAVDFATFAVAAPERFGNAPEAMEITSREIVVTGDWAYTRGNFSVNNAIEGKFLTILRRQDDWSWRIYRDSFSMNAD